ncbi:MAG: hypothetical protein SP1CHLAM54_10820 [Chlamydiia bacterium]|nr:hypothetical protein [Chlamydiia bacterium]MCH9615987.1 hypothetical protein [Chlamydiia bacterium]MCH9629010.1 hypothetical protein [Chlamydiia bacterium]
MAAPVGNAKSIRESMLKFVEEKTDVALDQHATRQPGEELPFNHEQIHRTTQAITNRLSDAVLDKNPDQIKRMDHLFDLGKQALSGETTDWHKAYQLYMEASEPHLSKEDASARVEEASALIHTAEQFQEENPQLAADLLDKGFVALMRSTFGAHLVDKAKLDKVKAKFPKVVEGIWKNFSIVQKAAYTFTPSQDAAITTALREEENPEIGSQYSLSREAMDRVAGLGSPLKYEMGLTLSVPLKVLSFATQLIMGNQDAPEGGGGGGGGFEPSASDKV